MMIPEITLTITLNAYFNEFSLDTQRNNNDRLHTWLVQTKFNMGTVDLENHCQVFLAADRSLDLSCQDSLVVTLCYLVTF